MTSKPSNNRDQLKRKYHGAIKTMLAICKAKGWSAHLESEDKDYQVGTIHISKVFNGHDEVTGIIEFTLVAGRFKYSIQKTSFYGYGIDALWTAILAKLENDGWMAPKDKKESKVIALPLEILSALIRNFDKVARQIRRRYNNRGSIEIKDEYDVQDLLHAILRAFFDDVRPEENTPSYAGGSSRIDFLLKKEKIVIEVKFASSKLREKEIGEQLIIDIRRYQAHPDCQHLYCLVYDPNGVIRNPVGLETDLSGTHDKVGVRVFVVPQ
jgi:hypothetical protein